MPFEEFREYFWEYIPQSIVSDLDLIKNPDWADSVVYEVWRINQYSGVDKSILLKLVENIMFSYQRFKPVFASEF